MHSLTKKLLVKEERARAIPVFIYKLQELSEDSGHMGGSGRNRGTVVSWQTMQIAQVTRERLKKKEKKNLLSFLHNKGSKNLDILSVNIKKKKEKGKKESLGNSVG